MKNKSQTVNKPFTYAEHAVGKYLNGEFGWVKHTDGFTNVSDVYYVSKFEFLKINTTATVYTPKSIVRSAEARFEHEMKQLSGNEK